MRCKSCGNEVKSDYKFCPFCASRLTQDFQDHFEELEPPVLSLDPDQEDSAVLYGEVRELPAEPLNGRLARAAQEPMHALAQADEWEAWEQNHRGEQPPVLKEREREPRSAPPRAGEDQNEGIPGSQHRQAPYGPIEGEAYGRAPRCGPEQHPGQGPYAGAATANFEPEPPQGPRAYPVPQGCREKPSYTGGPRSGRPEPYYAEETSSTPGYHEKGPYMEKPLHQQDAYSHERGARPAPQEYRREQAYPDKPGFEPPYQEQDSIRTPPGYGKGSYTGDPRYGQEAYPTPQAPPHRPDPISFNEGEPYMPPPYEGMPSQMRQTAPRQEEAYSEPEQVPDLEPMRQERPLSHKTERQAYTVYRPGKAKETPPAPVQPDRRSIPRQRDAWDDVEQDEEIVEDIPDLITFEVPEHPEVLPGADTPEPVRKPEHKNLDMDEARVSTAPYVSMKPEVVQETKERETPKGPGPVFKLLLIVFVVMVALLTSIAVYWLRSAKEPMTAAAGAGRTESVEAGEIEQEQSLEGLELPTVSEPAD